MPQTVQGLRCQVLPSGGQDGPDSDYESFVASFARGATAEISYGRYHRNCWGEASRFLPSPGFQIFAERGAAWLEMPERIQWSTTTTIQDERLPLEPTVGDVLNDQFHRLVRGDHSLAPTIRDAIKIAQLVQTLRQSQLEGGTVYRSP
jgi:hypothetical protein